MGNFFDDFEKELHKHVNKMRDGFDNLAGNPNSRFDFDSTAWKELEDFLSGNEKNSKDTKSTQNANQNYSQNSSQNYNQGSNNTANRSLNPMAQVMQAYANLGLQYTEDIDVVRKKYKKMVLEFHPDKYIDDKEMYDKSNAIIKKLSQSYMQICDYLKTKNKS